MRVRESEKPVDGLSVREVIKVSCFLLLLFSFPAFAWELSNPFSGSTYTTSDPDLQKYADVVKKDGRCSLAVILRARPNAPQVIRNLVSNQVFAFGCIGDIVIGENTLREQKGCGVFVLNGNTLSTEPISQSFGYGIVKDKCATGGFEKVVSQLGNYLASASSLPTERIVVYSDNKKYIDWFRKAKLQTETAARATLEKQHKSEGGYPKYYSGYQDTKGVPYTEIVSGDPLIKTP